MVAVTRLLLVGLGNAPYPYTRHSIGHLVIDSLAARFGVSFKANRSMRGRVRYAPSHYDTIESDGNACSRCIDEHHRSMCCYCTAKRMRRTIFHDCSSRFRISQTEHHSPKFGGSANGHNGVRSVIAALGGNANFHRVRIGIGRVDGDITNYVLGSLSSQERQFWREDGPGTDLVWNATTKIFTDVLRP
ncbi:hypothetical protein NM688_g6541 [Phlebia brevispora]|uniref:Uncharacterized protein n=1 Tax=Phlebia brevispora TaxID=194682 RepID=A0ACC1SF24_9APHY|nr:hypothetical protein NM688_g6541 [Phlebia brevispora]